MTGFAVDEKRPMTLFCLLRLFAANWFVSTSLQSDKLRRHRPAQMQNALYSREENHDRRRAKYKFHDRRAVRADRSQSNAIDLRRASADHTSCLARHSTEKRCSLRSLNAFSTLQHRAASVHSIGLLECSYRSRSPQEGTRVTERKLQGKIGFSMLLIIGDADSS